MEIKKVWVYIRVSTEQQSDGVWLETQQAKITEYLETYSNIYSYDKEKHFFIDKASWALEYREWLDALLLAAKNKEIDAIIVYRSDRLYRKIEYLAKAVTDFWEWGTTFIWVNDNVLLDWRQWKAQMLLFGVFAEMERDLIRDRTMQAKVVKADKWFYVWWGKPRLWYNIKHNWEGNKLIINKDEKRLVNKIFRLYTRNQKTLWEIRKILEIDWELTKHDRLLREGKIKKLGKTKEWAWDREVISKVLKSEMYIWKYYYWRYEYKVDKVWKKTRVEKPKEDMVELKSPVILDEPEMFWEAKILLDLNKKTRNNVNSYPFAWLIVCWECWKSYNGYRTWRKDQKHDYYRCKWSMRSSELIERCHNFNLSWSKVMDYVWSEIFDVFKDPEKYLNKLVKKEKKLNLAEQFETELEEAKKNRKELTTKLSIYLEKIENCNKFQVEAFQKLIDDYTDKLEKLDEFIIQCKKKVEDNKSFKDNIDNIVALKDRYTENMINFPLERKIEMIRQFVEKIVVNFDKGNFTVYFRFQRNPDDNEWWKNDWKGWGWGTDWGKLGDEWGNGHISNVDYKNRKRLKIGGNRHKRKDVGVVSSTMICIVTFLV